jgi:acetoin utilization deacetylase AcuC-like enzyme
MGTQSGSVDQSACASRRRLLLVLAAATPVLALAACRERAADAVATAPGGALPAVAANAGKGLQVFYLPAYVGAAHSFETTRKAGWVADSLQAQPIAGLRLSAHEALTEEQVSQVHAPAYVQAVRSGEPRWLAESQGFSWDPQLWDMVLASNGGVVAAARTALKDGVAGALASGLHHARHDHGAGFCTFNGLAIAVQALQADGVGRILILDLDAHCGGGTHSLVAGNPQVRQLDIAVNPFDLYAPSGHNSLDLLTNADDYLPLLARRLREIEGEPFDLCLYNAGMDPHEDCPVGGLPGMTAARIAERERMVFGWCRQRALPVAFVLAGGYIGPRLDRQGLVGLHYSTLLAASGQFRVAHHP